MPRCLTCQVGSDEDTCWMCGVPYNSAGVPGSMACAWHHDPERYSIYTAFAGHFQVTDDDVTGYPF